MRNKIIAVMAAAMLLVGCAEGGAADIPPITRMETGEITVMTVSKSSAESVGTEAPEVTEKSAETEISPEVTGESLCSLPKLEDMPDEPDMPEEPDDIIYNVLSPGPLSPEADELLRTDYAAYVSARDGREVTADEVFGKFYYGSDNGHAIVVMCPYECYTNDIKRYSLRYTDIDLTDPWLDCYPYLDIELPSGSFEMLVYGEEGFTGIEDAIEAKLISYDAVQDIHMLMESRYIDGDRSCVYTTEVDGKNIP